MSARLPLGSAPSISRAPSKISRCKSLKGELRQKRLGMAGLPAAFISAWLVWCLAEVGEFCEAIAIGEKGVRIAEEVDHPFSLVVACAGVGMLYLRQGDPQQAIAVLERGLEVCRVWHIPLMFPWVASALGAAYSLEGRLAEAQSILEGYGTATISVWPGFLGTLPEDAGRIDLALDGPSAGDATDDG